MSQVSNRIHRAGAIDFNTGFAIRQARILNDKRNALGKRVYQQGDCEDCLSVCEGEPVYSSKRHKSNDLTSCGTNRDPLACISSVNGLVIEDGFDPNLDRKGGTDTASVRSHEEMRDKFFKSYHYQGVSVSKWEYEKAGRQQEQFVTTAGGLNSIYCDADCQAGDTVVVDIPCPTNPDVVSKVYHYDPSSGDRQTLKQWGFVKCAKKRGIPVAKQTLVVRPMPPLPSATGPLDEMKKLRQSFLSRGQVLGRCVNGGRKGGRIDVVLASNAINGCINLSDMNA